MSIQEDIKAIWQEEMNRDNENVEEFKERYKCYGEAAKERNEQRERFMADENWLNNLARDIQIYRRVRESIDKALGESSLDTPDLYRVQEYLGIK